MLHLCGVNYRRNKFKINTFSLFLNGCERHNVYIYIFFWGGGYFCTFDLYAEKYFFFDIIVFKIFV